MKVYSVYRYCNAYHCDCDCKNHFGEHYGTFVDRDYAADFVSDMWRQSEEYEAKLKELVSEACQLIAEWFATLPEWHFKDNHKIKRFRDLVDFWLNSDLIDLTGYFKHESHIVRTQPDFDEIMRGVDGYIPAPILPDPIVEPAWHGARFEIVEHEVRKS